jgi:hypothetical protein
MASLAGFFFGFALAGLREAGAFFAVFFTALLAGLFFFAARFFDVLFRITVLSPKSVRHCFEPAALAKYYHSLKLRVKSVYLCIVALVFLFFQENKRNMELFIVHTYSRATPHSSTISALD